MTHKLAIACFLGPQIVRAAVSNEENPTFEGTAQIVAEFLHAGPYGPQEVIIAGLLVPADMTADGATLATYINTTPGITADVVFIASATHFTLDNAAHRLADWPATMPQVNARLDAMMEAMIGPLDLN